MRIAMSVVVGAACALTSGGRELPTAPPPRAKPTDADWLPKPVPGQGLLVEPPSAFPELVPPVPQMRVTDAYRQHQEALAKACPRLYGMIAVTIEANDDTLRKLLKARLHQGVSEYRMMQFSGDAVSGPPRPDIVRYSDCLLDVQSAAIELWASRPKELVPWLEELVLVVKNLERIARDQFTVGIKPPSELTAARRLRLKFEAELWKAKNAK